MRAACLFTIFPHDLPMLKVYCYQNCGTCRKALKWLDENGLPYQSVAIRETPPSVSELKTMLNAHDGELRRLFNTSSQDYRQASLKDRLPDMTEDEAFALLRGNGNLVKRPFVIGENVAVVGFKPETWSERLL